MKEKKHTRAFTHIERNKFEAGQIVWRWKKREIFKKKKIATGSCDVQKMFKVFLCDCQLGYKREY